MQREALNSPICFAGLLAFQMNLDGGSPENAAGVGD